MLLNVVESCWCVLSPEVAEDVPHQARRVGAPA